MPSQHSDALDDPILWIRQEAFGGGVDAFTRASRLGETHWVAGLNCWVDQSQRIQTRPGTANIGTAPFAEGITGLGYLETPAVRGLLATSGEAVKVWDAVSWEDAPAGWLPTAGARVHSVQGLDRLLLADGVQSIHTWDGAAFADLGSGAGEPPAGAKIAHWHTYRAFYAGIAGAPDALHISDILDPGSVVSPTWVTRVGAGEGEAVTALASLQDSWLAVFKPNSIWLIDASPLATSAAQWRVQQLTGGIGAVGPRAVTRFGTDTYFFGRDGVRTLRRMAASAGEYETSAPLSQPIQPIIERVNWAAAETVAAGTFDQFVFFALPLDEALAPSHVVVWNGRLNAWLGVWSWGAQVFGQSNFGDVRNLIWGGNDGSIRRWLAGELETEGTYLDAGEPYRTEWLSRAFDWGDALAQKEAWRGELRFVESAADTDIDLLVDGEAVAAWSTPTQFTQNELPVDLPVDLATAQPFRWKRGLGKRKFRELQVRLRTPAGKLVLESASFSAFGDPYR